MAQTLALQESHNTRRSPPWMLTPGSDPQRQRVVRDSHERSRASGLSPDVVCDFSTQSAADFRITQERNGRLFTQALPVMEMLMEQVSHSGSMVVLSDGTGTILRTHCHGTFMEQAEKVALRTGVSWAENSKGTNAIGTALLLESDIVIHANEHFVRHNHVLTCTASPIFDHAGGVIGVLDVTGDQRSYHPHTMGLVKLSAQTIENSWFRDHFQQSICLHFHSHPEMIGTVAEGILALDAQGQVLGVNRAGLRMLNMGVAALRARGLQDSIGLNFGQLVQALRYTLTHGNSPLVMQLMCGKRLYARISADSLMPAKHWRAGAAGKKSEVTAASETVAPTLPPVHASVAVQVTPKQEVPLTIPSLQELGAHDVRLSAMVDKINVWLDSHSTSSSPLPLVLTGESGTGKQWWARAIHAASARAQASFVLLHGEDMSDDAFAQAQEANGLLARAQGGTLYIKDIETLSLAAQNRLLRLLRDKRLPGLAQVPWDVMLICGASKSLRSLCDANLLRMDFYHHIQAFSLHLPRLHERMNLKELAQSMLKQQTFSERMLSAMHHYEWPGNVRQLAQVLQAAQLLCREQSVLDVEHFSLDFLQDIGLAASAPVSASKPQRFSTLQWTASDLSAAATPDAGDLHEMEVKAIRAAIAQFDGNVSKAAKRLGISRNTIYRKLKI